MEEGNHSGDLVISGGHSNAQEEYAMRTRRRLALLSAKSVISFPATQHHRPPFGRYHIILLYLVIQARV